MSYTGDRLMNQRSISERADYLSRRRARMLPFLAIIYFTQQASFLSALGDGTHRDSEHFKIGAWVVLSLVLLAALATKGFWLQPRAVRDLIDDEGTRANRLAATSLGLLCPLCAALRAHSLCQRQP